MKKCERRDTIIWRLNYIQELWYPCCSPFSHLVTLPQVILGGHHLTPWQRNDSQRHGRTRLLELFFVESLGLCRTAHPCWRYVLFLNIYHIDPHYCFGILFGFTRLLHTSPILALTATSPVFNGQSCYFSLLLDLEALEGGQLGWSWSQVLLKKRQVKESVSKVCLLMFVVWNDAFLLYKYMPLPYVYIYMCVCSCPRTGFSTSC